MCVCVFFSSPHLIHHTEDRARQASSTVPANKGGGDDDALWPRCWFMRRTRHDRQNVRRPTKRYKSPRVAVRPTAQMAGWFTRERIAFDARFCGPAGRLDARVWPFIAHMCADMYSALYTQSKRPTGLAGRCVAGKTPKRERSHGHGDATSIDSASSRRRVLIYICCAALRPLIDSRTSICTQTHMRACALSHV